MGIQINGNTNNINAGIGSLSIEDLNELDIVGVATAANFKTGVSNLHSVGLSLSGGQIDVGSNIKIGNAGVITATSFVGSGANLTGISGVSVANQADNRLITATGTTDALNGEANLTFDGSSLDIFNGSNSSTIKLKRHASTASEQAHIGYFSSGLHIETRESTYISLKTNTQERLRITSAGDVGIGTAIPIFATGYGNLSLAGSDGGQLEFKRVSSDIRHYIWAHDDLNIGGGYHNGSSSSIIFLVNGSNERLRITSGGVLLTNQCPALETTAGAINITGGASGGRIALQGTTTSAGGGLAEIFGFWGTNKVAGMVVLSGADTSNKDDGHLVFYTSSSGPSVTERLRIDSSGRLLVGTNSSSSSVRAVFQGYPGGGSNFQARVQFQTNQATNLSAGQHIANLLFTNASNSVGAQIDVKADEAWGTSDYPGRIEFLTTANGASSPTIRMIVKNDGIVNIGVASPQYAKKVNIQGGNDATISLSNQDYTGHAAGSQSGIEGRLQCGGGIWSTSGVRFKKENGTSGDKHTRLELYATDGYQNKTGLIVHPDGQVTKPTQPMCSFTVNNTSAGNDITHNSVLTNNGNHFNTSNNRFVCPVTGFYYASIMVMSNNSNTTMDLQLHKNGSNPGHILVPYQAATGGQYNQVSGSCIIECSANDYLTFRLNSGSVYAGRHSNITFCLLA